MSTRSNIILKVKKEDIGRELTHEFKGVKYTTKIEKPYIGVYCHFDGYPSGVGAELFENIKDYEEVLALISGGCMSSIDEGIPDYYMDWERDEQWKANKPKQSDIPETCYSWIEYAYIFDEGKWHVGLVEWHDDETETIGDIIELTEEVIANGHPKENSD